MEIWSSPAAYDELNGNAERGGGADPIARELEEGGGARGCGGAGAALGVRGRGLPRSRPTAPGLCISLGVGSPPHPLIAIRSLWGHCDPRRGSRTVVVGRGMGKDLCGCGAGGSPPMGCGSPCRAGPPVVVAVYVLGSVWLPGPAAGSRHKDAHAPIISN